MKSKFQFSEEADVDLEDIAFHTFMKWGEHQSDKYLAKLKDCITALSENPFLGKEASEIVSELRVFPFKSHYIFYFPRDTGILIVRILGQSMDYNQHL